MICYIAYTVLCFMGLSMCMWMLYDLGDFKKTIRPEVWAFITTVASVLIIAGIHAAKEFLRSLQSQQY